MDIKQATEKELRDELDRRIPRPSPLPFQDFTSLSKLIISTVNSDDEDEDFEHYVYEAAMEAVYGPTYWKWRNSFK